MIALALPWVFGLACAGALVITALHFFSVRRPAEILLPTTRFVPNRTVRAVSRATRPSDVLLLLTRIAALTVAGLAAAGPRWRTSSVTRLVLAVGDRGVTPDTIAVRQLVMREDEGATHAGRLAVVMASAHAPDEPAALFPLAWRAAAHQSMSDAGIDSIDLHIMLSRAPAAHDAGLGAWRDSWPGRVVVHHVPSAAVRRRGAMVVMENDGGDAPDDDAVQAAMMWHAARSARANAMDTVWLARASGLPKRTDAVGARAVRVYWPIDGVPRGWRALAAPDSSAALVSAGVSLLGSWSVTAVPGTATSAHAIAWWSDGRVAATEEPTSGGCDRQVAVVTLASSDALLASSANVLFDQLLGPCAGSGTGEVLASTLVERETYGAALAAAANFRGADTVTRRNGVSAWLTVLLFALALVLLLVEWRLRERHTEVMG